MKKKLGIILFVLAIASSFGWLLVNHPYIAIAVVIAGYLTLGVVGYRFDKKKWNNGVCPKCGNKWESQFLDSQGGRGYICRRCNKGMVISWKVDKNYCNNGAIKK
jgi:hypothetical protein